VDGVLGTHKFRRVNGFMHLPALRKALEHHVFGTDTAPRYDADDEVAA
jgi:hypothetical protein